MSNYESHSSHNNHRPSPRKMLIDPKKNDNLQLCIDVPFSDHPYLIGPRGRKCQYFMSRYHSLIHFPDSNCHLEGPKINNVLVTGTMKDVEEIRSQIRMRSPVRVTIQLQRFPDPRELIRQVEAAISERSLPIRFNHSDDQSTGMLKSEWRNQETLITFCDEFFDLTNSGGDSSELFTLAIALLPLINPWNSELSHRLIGSIYEQTGCRIFYPPMGPTIVNVLHVAQFLIGLTMFQISFYLPAKMNSSNIDYQKVADWQRDFLVHTTVEPVLVNNNNRGEEPTAHKVILRSFEFCLNSVYALRSFLLGFKKSIRTQSYEFMGHTKFLIPSTVFAESKLYFPLYSVDDKRSFDWSNISNDEFFDKFYGGPNSSKERDLPSSSTEDACKCFKELQISNSPIPKSSHFSTIMPFLQVTKEQLEAVDQKALERAVRVADQLASGNRFHRSFGYSDYAVSYPAKIGIDEFNRQYKETMRREHL